MCIETKQIFFLAQWNLIQFSLQPKISSITSPTNPATEINCWTIPPPNCAISIQRSALLQPCSNQFTLPPQFTILTQKSSMQQKFGTN